MSQGSITINPYVTAVCASTLRLLAERCTPNSDVQIQLENVETYLLHEAAKNFSREEIREAWAQAGIGGGKINLAFSRQDA